MSYHDKPLHPTDSKANIAAESQKDSAVMPEWLPQKFWDSNSGEVRLQELVKSYRALEKRLSSFSKADKKEASVEKHVEKHVDKPAEKNSKTIAEPSAEPIEKPIEKPENSIEDSVDTSAPKALSDGDLIAEFGSLERFERLRPQIARWAKHNLSAGMHDVLSASIDGLRIMNNLMQSSSKEEPQLVEGGDVPQVLSESRLRRMMQDPRYWRDRDPEFINRVMAGFRQLYDN